jgi:hypothetical protein
VNETVNPVNTWSSALALKLKNNISDALFSNTVLLVGVSDCLVILNHQLLIVVE